MKKDNVFIFTTRIFDNEGKNALFQNCEKVKINDDIFLQKNLYSFNKLNLHTQKKRALLEDIYKDKEILKEFLFNLHNKKERALLVDIYKQKKKFSEFKNPETKTRILIKLYKNKEITDELYKDFIEIYSNSKESLPFSLSEIYKDNSMSPNRLYISKVKDKNIFGYRTLDLGTKTEILNTRQNFIYSLVSDISDYFKVEDIKSFFENKNVFLILHEKDINFPPKTDYALTNKEIVEYLIKNNPKLINTENTLSSQLSEIEKLISGKKNNSLIDKEVIENIKSILNDTKDTSSDNLTVLLKNTKVVIFQETIGGIMNILTNTANSTDIEKILLHTINEIWYSGDLIKVFLAYERARIKFSFSEQKVIEKFRRDVSDYIVKLLEKYNLKIDKEIKELNKKLDEELSKKIREEILKKIKEKIKVRKEVNSWSEYTSIDKYDILIKIIVKKIDLKLN